MDGSLEVVTSAMEHIAPFGFGKEQCNVVFVFKGETDKQWYCPSSFLNRISKEFQKNMLKKDDGSHYEIKAEGFGVHTLTKALSFYQPKYFKYFKDSDDFKGILTVCSKFGLIDLKKRIQSYLIKEHELIASSTSMNKQLFPFLQMAKDFGMGAMYDKIIGLEFQSSFTQEIAKSTNSNAAFIGIKDCLKYEIIEKCINTQIDKGLIEVHHFPLLQMAKELGNDAFYDKIMSFEVGFSFTEHIANSHAFAGMNDNLKYEIFKKCIKRDIDTASSNQKTAVTLEVISIFHFLDLYYYENRILDYALSKNTATALIASNKVTYNPSIFFEKNEINDILVKVEGKQLFVNATVLSDNSPVFKAMLNSNFKEGLENVIELPGKRADDIIELFTSLIHGRKITEYNTFTLFPLCREYQIDWLRDLIQEKMMQLQLTSDRLRLEYLNLSHNMGFVEGEEYFVNSLCESFILLQRYKEFNHLKDEAKLLVALRRLWYIYIYCCLQRNPSTSSVTSSANRSLSNLFHKESGLPSIFNNVKKVPFKINSVEHLIVHSFSYDSTQPPQRPKLPPFSIQGKNC